MTAAGAGPTGGGGFGQRLAAAMDAHGPLCVGIDPHAPLLAQWGLPDDPSGIRELGLRVVEELAGHVAAVKPQSAFFERHGPAGWAALQEVLLAAREAGLLTILDVKRGDIGSTMAAYAATHLTDDAPMPADAITVSPYLGTGSLDETAATAAPHGRGIFVLALTSNPEGHQVQHVGGPGASVAGEVVRWAGEQNALRGGTPGPVGLVVGGTTGDAARRLGIDLSAAGGIVLAPGLGAQGATTSDLRAGLDDVRDRVLATSARAILSAGAARGSLREAAAAMAASARRALRES